MRKFRIVSAVVVGVSLALSMLVTGCASPGDMSDSGGSSMGTMGSMSSSMGSSTGGY
jgi:hypothetical protein